MDYRELADYRQELLDLYNSLEFFCEEFNESSYEIDSELRAMQENVEAEKFLLAIFGEVKAGKSTFINALLKEEILPSDVLQATSEIIEVHKSKKKKAEVTFVNGEVKVVEDDPQTPEDEVVLFLKDIASVNEEYRGIPIVQVHRFLSDHYSKEYKKAVFGDYEKELETFLSSDLEYNNSDEKEFKEKIREYIKQNISCDKIPLTVSLGYPHDFSGFKHFRVVDTPGVNATGGIEERTKKFIKDNEADAAIYLHKVPPVESKALRNALTNELPERVKYRLLVLTHRSGQDEDENERILKEAERLYSEIGSNNIFFVDSLTELHLQKFYGAKTIDEIDAIRATDQKLRGQTARLYEEAGGDRDKFLNLLRDQANFSKIRDRIREDARSSAATQMKKFANDMREAYESLDKSIEARIASLSEKSKDPQVFASQIQDQIDEKDRMKRGHDEFKDTLKAKFFLGDENSSSSQKMNQIVRGFLDDIKKKEFDPNESNDQKAKSVQDYFENLNQNWIDKMSEFIGNLNADYQHEVADRNIKLQSDYPITQLETDLGSIWDAAFTATKSQIKEQLDQVDKKRRVNRRVLDVVTNVVFRIRYPKSKVVRYSKATENERNKIWRSFPIRFEKKLQKRYEAAKIELTRQIDAMINNVFEEDKRELDKEIQKLNQRIKKLEEEKEKNEELKKEISSLEDKRTDINKNILECRKVGSQL